MSMRVCSQPGCPTLVAKPGRCSTHRAQHERQRGTRQQRGYDRDYDNTGRAYQRRMDAGERFNCWRCREPLQGTRRGTHWVLGHDDADRSLIRGPEHPRCNYATATHRQAKPDT